MLKLLIAEDESREAEFLQKFITENFLKVYQIVAVCHDGESAIEAGKLHKPNVVLLDIEMPKASGILVAKTLRSLMENLHILFLTAHGTFDYAKEAISIGVEDYLLKPYTEEDLFHALQRIVDKVVEKQQKGFQSLLKEISDTPTITNQHPIIRQAMQYIEEHYADKISLESLSDMLGFSPGYVSKCLKKYLDKSFSSLLLDHRIQKSIEILANENVTVSEVAYRVGFSDPNYFYKCFQKEVGMQPKKFAFSIKSSILEPEKCN